MERHKCKLCLKRFSNGRALGGHMRSHLFNLPIPVQLSEETESASSPYSSSSSSDKEEVEELETGEDQDQDQDGEEKGTGVYNYVLRENPKRSIRLVDPEFSVASVVLQDRESETESSKNLTRRRSKRTRKFLLDQNQHDHLHFHQSEEQEEINLVKKIKSFKATESEPASSISDATTEEVAFCLMMLSRDKWKRKEEQIKVLQDEEEYEETEKSVEKTDESGEINKSNYKIINNVNRSIGGKYRCETCNKMFKSYQALGGHRASHKKLKIQTPISKEKTKLEAEHIINAGTTCSEKKNHQCPYCFRVFSSGQALGGHKRSHLIGVAPNPVAVAMSSYSTKLGAGANLNSNSSIDLNLPPPIDDDDLSQIELSAVSDAEFVNHIKR